MQKSNGKIVSKEDAERDYQFTQLHIQCSHFDTPNLDFDTPFFHLFH